VVVLQTIGHVDEQAPYLYMTLPTFPVGAGSGADGYVAWLEGHPSYAASGQFAQQAGLYAGATSTVREAGLTDARAAYSYMGALLAPALGFYGAFVAVNAAAWLAAALATWYLAAQLLGNNRAAYTAGLLTACGQGFVFMAGTPMSYALGYAWEALLLALALRWRLFGWRSAPGRWLIWGWLCGVSGLFYFTHVVLLGTAWIFGLRRSRLPGLVAATAATLVVPALWFLVGRYAVGLAFNDETAQDLARSVRHLEATAVAAPLRLPAEAGITSVRALVGGYYYAVLGCAVVGVVAAPPRRRQWYLAVALCGLGPAFVLHGLPVTQRYGYLSYPAVHVAAVEGVLAIGRALANGVRRVPWASRSSAWTRRAAWEPALLGALALAQVIQANADLVGMYRFALAFGAP